MRPGENIFYGNGVLVTILPCIAFSEIRRMLHGGQLDDSVDPCLVYCLLAYLTSCIGCCLYTYGTRTDIRRKYNLREDPCNDCCVHLLCHPCALCQEYRELKNHPLTEWPPPDKTVTSPDAQNGLTYSYPDMLGSGHVQQSAYFGNTSQGIVPTHPLRPEPPAQVAYPIPGNLQGPFGRPNVSPHRSHYPQYGSPPGPRVTPINPAPSPIVNPTPVPGQPTAYPGQPAGYPGSPTAYPGSPTAYPGSPTAYPGSPTAYPGSPTGYPSHPVPPRGYPGGMQH